MGVQVMSAAGLVCEASSGTSCKKNPYPHQKQAHTEVGLGYPCVCKL